MTVVRSPIMSPIRSPIYDPAVGKGGGITYDADASALFARFTTPPTDARKLVINQLILDLKAAGVWSKLDALYLLAAADNQAARRNWKQDLYNLTAVSAPAFTSDRGYTGDGSGSYLTSPFNPATAGGQFTQDSAHQCAWVGTDVTNSAMFEVGNLNSRLNARRTATDIGVAANQSAVTLNLGLSTAIGWTCWSRSSSAGFEAVRNLGTPVSSVSASAALSSLPFYVCAIANTGPAPLSFSTRRVQAVSWGAALNDTERDALYNALNTYMTAVGAV